MKKYLVFLLLAALAVSCSKPAPVTETVTQPVEVTVEEKTVSATEFNALFENK